MAEKITGIVLNVRKYNDRNNIITIYTRERGRLAFISPAGSGKGSNARRARLQPLSVITTEIKFKPAAELQHLGAVYPCEIWKEIYFQPEKMAIVLFISEFLYKLLNATMPDKAMFDFIVQSLRLLDNMKERISDFHLVFLISMLSYSGIQPDVSDYEEGKVFEFSSGSFVNESESKGPVVVGDDARLIPYLSRITFSNMRNLRLTSMNRRQILYGLLNYFSYHYPGLGGMKSPEVLREVFESP